ncbi:ArgE/DapE family deacylase [Bacillus tianshenii]|nr:ArgE/DapE family deacylase [Bacillus tianshenii]
MDVKEQIQTYIEENKETFFKTIQEAVRIESVVGNEVAMQSFMKRKYEELGLEVHEVQPEYEKLSKHEAFVDSKISFENRKNVIGIFRGTGGGHSLTLHGHVDVVSPEPTRNWTVEPWGGEMIQNKLYGRGSADMKAGLIANWFALKAVIDLGFSIKGDIQLHSVIEEETGGGGGALACLEEGYLTDGYISTEPHALNVTISHAGILYFRIKVKGKTAHGGMAHMGINAISKMIKIYTALEQLDEKRAKEVHFELFEKGSGQAVHLNRGTLNSGDWVSTVPGEAVLESRIGFIPGETREAMKELITRTVMEATKGDEWLEENPPVIEWFGWSTEPWYQEPSDPFVTSFVETASNVIEQEVEVIGRASGNDARFTQYYNKPGICFGPKGNSIHGPDEYVELDSVIQVANVFANYIVNWANTDKDLNEGKTTSTTY